MAEPSDIAKGTVAALIVAAGKGLRAGGEVPKQYQPVGGTPVLARTLAAFADHPAITEVIVVVSDGDEPHWQPIVAAFGNAKGALRVASGGESRQQSVRSGLEAMAASPPGIVLIHDGARPFIRPADIDAIIGAVRPGGGAMPGSPVVDTLRQVGDDGTCGQIVPRDGVWRAQTPQAFDYGAILAAHRAATGPDVSDDVALASAAGMAVAAVETSPDNFKITTAADFARAERFLARTVEATAVQTQRLPRQWRTGTGYDVHRLAPSDAGLWLCGVHLAHDHHLVGHSDADVALHALTDALLGAAGLGDIGQHFPPSQERWRGASSDRFVTHAVALIAAMDGQIANADITIICEAPKVGPHRRAMRERVAELLGIAPGGINIKATTTEGLGFTGRHEGIAALASVSLSLPDRAPPDDPHG